MDSRNIGGWIFSVSLGIYFFAYVAIPALVELFGVNLTGLPTSLQTLVTTVIGIAVAAGAIMAFMPTSMKSKIGLS
jgi:hypothetical protein